MVQTQYSIPNLPFKFCWGTILSGCICVNLCLTNLSHLFFFVSQPLSVQPMLLTEADTHLRDELHLTEPAKHHSLPRRQMCRQSLKARFLKAQDGKCWLDTGEGERSQGKPSEKVTPWLDLDRWPGFPSERNWRGASSVGEDTWVFAFILKAK